MQGKHSTVSWPRLNNPLSCFKAGPRSIVARPGGVVPELHSPLSQPSMLRVPQIAFGTLPKSISTSRFPTPRTWLPGHYKPKPKLSVSEHLNTKHRTRSSTPYSTSSDPKRLCLQTDRTSAVAPPKRQKPEKEESCTWLSSRQSSVSSLPSHSSAFGVFSGLRSQELGPPYTQGLTTPHGGIFGVFLW